MHYDCKIKIKNMKRYCFIIAVSFVLFNIVLLIKIKKIRNIYLYEHTNIMNERNMLEKRVRYFKILYQFSLAEKLHLKKEIIIKNNKKTLMLGDVINKNKKYLVFYYSFNNCDICIDMVLKKLYKSKNILSKLEIIILTYQTDYQDYVVEKKYIKEFPMFLLGTVLDKKLSDYNMPILFVK